MEGSNKINKKRVKAIVIFIVQGNLSKNLKIGKLLSGDRLNTVDFVSQ